MRACEGDERWWGMPVLLRRRVAVQAVRRRRWERRETAPLPCVRTGGGKDKNRIVSFEVAMLKISPLLTHGRSCIVLSVCIARAFRDLRQFLCNGCERKAKAPECTEAFE